MKKIVSLMLTLIFILSLSLFAFADTTTTSSNQSNSGTVSTQTISTSTNTSALSESQALNDIADGGLPNVSIDQASSWAEKKGFDVVKLLQTFVQPFAIIIFILSAMVLLLGVFGNSQWVGRGLWGMFFSVIIYAGVLYAPQILDFGRAWLAS